jgi:GntR family transcriptional regulator/MocR family aminotransferase
VVPKTLLSAFVRARTLTDRGPATLGQAVLGEFMAQGLLAPHVRRMRTEYAKRRAALLAALAAHCPRLTPLAAPGGLHMVGLLPEDCDEMAVCPAASARGARVAPLGAYYVGPARQRGIVFGFAGTPVAVSGDAARRLNAAIGERSSVVAPRSP